MQKARWFGLAAMIGLLLYCVSLTPRPVAFRDINDAAAKIKAAGFHVTSDRADGIIQSGFLVTTDKVDQQDVNLLCKVGRMGPEWKGKVWVTYLSRCFVLTALPENASTRTWGDVLAYGDSQLLEQLDASLRQM